MGKLDDMVILTGNASRNLALGICKELGKELDEAEITRFNNGEVKIKLGDRRSVHGKKVFIINSTEPPAENIIELALLIDAVARSSAGEIHAVIPSYGYARQDRKDRPRVPISAKVMSRIISHDKLNSVLLLDPHSEAIMGYFPDYVTANHLYASAILIPEIKKIMKRDFLVASPDEGGVPRAEAYSRRLGLGGHCVVFYKSRPKPGEINKELTKIIGSVKGKDVLFIDDMIDSGGTLVANAEVAKAAGAKDLYAAVTHGIFSGKALVTLPKHFKKVIFTNSIYRDERYLPDTFQEVKADPLLADAILRIYERRSLSELFLNN